MTLRQGITLSAIILAAFCSGIGANSNLAANEIAPASPRIFRLGESSTFQEGCFPPCLCPILASVNVRGTLKLTPVGFDGSFQLFAVEEVNWTVQLGDPERRITGSGTYRIELSESSVQPLHRLQLDLTVDDEETEHFDSGLVAATDDRNIAITISINDMFCWDRVIVVNAAPVPPHKVRPYRLVRDSTYQHGCWDPCDCPIEQERALIGSFDLVELEANPFFSEFAVVNFRCRVQGSIDADVIQIAGFGTYLVHAEFAVQNRMGLDLIVDGSPLTHFDSGLVVGGSDFPRIDVTVSINGMYCLDTVLHLKAVPHGGAD